MKILLIDDERDLLWSLKQILLISGYDVDTASDGREGLDYLNYSQYDLVISDVMMPVMDGITMVKTMRQQGNKTPVLLLTAKSQIDDKVDGLDSGADDYLTKPFVAKELLAHIRALSRRGTESIDLLHIGNVTLDPNLWEMKTEKQTVKLTSKEFKLMECFIKNKNSYISTEDILAKVWDSDTDAELNVVWVFISALRKKLDNIDADVTIKANRGVGYRIEKK